MNAIDSLHYWLARHSWRYYQAREHTVELELPTRRVRVPVGRGIGRDLLRFHEDNVAAAFSTIVKFRPGTFIDVGANIGQTLFNLLSVDANLPYVGFEPNLVCAGFVERLMSMNRLVVHKLIPCGLSDRLALADLMYNSDLDVSASTVEGFRPKDFFAHRRKVLLCRGDDVLSSLHLERPTVIKIDVEGAELEAIVGLEKTIRSHRPLLVYEVLARAHANQDIMLNPELTDEDRRQFVQKRSQRIAALDAKLHELQYESYFIHRDGQFTPIASLDAADSLEELELNFVAVSVEDRAAFERYAGSRIRA